MKKEITLGQLVSVSATLLIAIVTAWVTINNKVSVHSEAIESIKKRQDRTDVQLDKIDATTTTILFELQKTLK